MSNVLQPRRSGTTTIDGCNIAWSEIGRGRPVLFIHGTAASGWGDLAERVGVNYRAIQYDRRGFGDSKHPPVDNLSQHARDAATLLDAVEARDVLVVGWSIGGIIAAELASRNPSRIRGMVLLEPPLWAKKHPTLNLFNGVVLSIILGLVAGPTRGGRRFSRWVFRDLSGGNSLDTAERSFSERIDANAAAIGVEIRAGTGEHLGLAELSAISTPTMVFAGDRSQRFLAEGAHRMATAIPDARFTVLPGASHLLQFERSDDIAAAILQMDNLSKNHA